MNRVAASLACCLLGAPLLAQAPFPVGLDGEVYLAPRIDLVPAADGGPYTITPDGVLDEPVWKRAAFHTVNTNLLNPGELAIDLIPVENDWQMIFAAVADSQYLYVAWKVADDPDPDGIGPLVTGEQAGCNVWQDDSIEIYIDAGNNGPSCLPASCYTMDDAQLTIGADQVGKPAPEELQFGGVTGGHSPNPEQPSCDFGAPAPELMLGMVLELQQGDLGPDIFTDRTGWQAEVAIALTTNGNADDASPTWEIDPSHGTCIGFALQGNDDDRVDTDLDGDVDSDDGPFASRDHKFTWAKREVDESAWRNPGVFGKLAFFDPTKPISANSCAYPVEQLACFRNIDNTVRVNWKNPGTADPTIPIKILVDGVEKASVPGDMTTATLSEADVPRDGVDHVITVQNNSEEAPPSCTIAQAPFTDCGAVRHWNILGLYDNPPGAAPGEEAIRRDYMTDGVTGEVDFVWKPGATILTDFGGAAASTSIQGGLARRNPDGVPTVFEWVDIDGRVAVEPAFRGAFDYVMVYAQVYLINETGGDLEVFLVLTSDDSVQVYLNGEEVWINNVPRPAADPCSPVGTPGIDIVPDGFIRIDPIVLVEGQNSLILKVFEGEGGFEYGLRMQDAEGNPITEGLHTSLIPTEICANRLDDDGDSKIDCADEDCAAVPACQQPRLVRGDVNGDARINITDPIALLSFLFQGGPAPPCRDAADADDASGLNITDPIYLLSYLFQGGQPPLAPGPSTANYVPADCGVDSTADALDCLGFPPCP